MCERKADTVCGAAKSAMLGPTSGDVTLLAKTSVAPAQGGALLLDNDRVIAREGSSVIDLGPNCLVTILPKTVAMIYRPDAARVCVSVSDLAPPPVQAQVPVQAPVQAAMPGMSPLVYAGVGVAIAGGITAAVLAKGKDGASAPVSNQ